MDAPPNSNGYEEELGPYIDAIDREEDDLDRKKSAYMLECKGPRGRINETLKAARKAGVNMKAFREVLKHHYFERKSVKRIEELEPDDRAAFDSMMEGLGAYAETPLGQAALNKVRPKNDGDQTLSSLS